MDKVRCLIPCCGTGSRMKLPLGKSKEMLIDPKRNEPLISYTLELCEIFNLEPVVLSRPEKEDLNTHLTNKNVRFELITTFGDWPETMHIAEDFYADRNIMLFPNVRFHQVGVLEDMKNSLALGSKSCFALHKVNDTKNHVIVEDNNIINRPSYVDKDPRWAVGLIGFKKHEGVKLFTKLYNKNLPATTGMMTNYHFLLSFEDITKTGKVQYA